VVRLGALGYRTAMSVAYASRQACVKVRWFLLRVEYGYANYSPSYSGAGKGQGDRAIQVVITVWIMVKEQQ